MEESSRINKHSFGKLYFVGHGGAIKTLKRKTGKIMLVPDANLVLVLLNNFSNINTLPPHYKDFIRISKSRIRLCWHVREKWMPINPVLALMELSKQDEKADYKLYLSYYNNFFEKIYNITNVSPIWTLSTYAFAMKALLGTHQPIMNTIEKVYSLIPPDDKPSDSEIIVGCEKLFEWIWSERESLAIIGGPIMYASVYAIAGSPDARKLLKYKSALKRGVSETAKNVAWDFLYWVMLENDYHFKRYDNTIICTGDEALANLIGNRVNTGPRFQPDVGMENSRIDSCDNFTPFKFKRLVNTNLERQIHDKLLVLLYKLDVYVDDAIKFGFNNIYE